MGNVTAFTVRVQARVPRELYLQKRGLETDSELVVRALKSLRDGHGDTGEHNLLVKMVKVFAKHGIKMDLTKQEIEMVKRLYTE